MEIGAWLKTRWMRAEKWRRRGSPSSAMSSRPETRLATTGMDFRQARRDAVELSIVFYARRAQIPVLLEAVDRADCQIVNNGAKVEIYADDVRKMRRFALVIREIIANVRRA